jgi:hypothetical protein
MKLRIPSKLVVVALSAGLAGCPGSGMNNNPQPQQSLCPPEYFCSSDAARAFNCTDMSPDPFASDLGTCYPPI